MDAGLVALESISPGKDIYYSTLRCRMLPSKENYPRQQPAPWFLRQILLSLYSAVLSFPPRGVTGTSCYRFEYDLHLIKIPSHLEASILAVYTCLACQTLCPARLSVSSETRLPFYVRILSLNLEVSSRMIRNHHKSSTFHIGHTYVSLYSTLPQNNL